MIDPAARRRRRLVLAALVVVCLVLITAGFGASGGASGGPLGALGEGGSKIAKPLRDLVHWVGDTADAKGENEALRKDAATLRERNVELQAELRKFPNMQCLSRMVDDLNLQRNDPLAANVIGHDPTAWATTITIDRGTNDGVQLRQAVVGAAGPGAGLVGFVSAVRGNLATVSLLPSQGVAVGAYLDGVKQPRIKQVLTIKGAGAGTVSDLELEFVPSTTPPEIGALVTTSGTTGDTDQFPSNAPPNIPIGRVWKVDAGGTDEQIGHVRPLVNLRTLEDVQVLRRVVNDNRAARRTSSGAARSATTCGTSADRTSGTSSSRARSDAAAAGAAAETTGTTGPTGATGATGSTGAQTGSDTGTAAP